MMQPTHADPADLKPLQRLVADGHRRWIGNNPEATLADLHAFLVRVQDDFGRFDDDAVLADIADELGEAGEYLNEFEEFTRPVCPGGSLPTVGYRMSEVEEDIENVEELIELVGESYRPKRLLPPKKQAKK